MTQAARLSLAGLRILIPRGGDLGDRLATSVAEQGGEPVIAPIIEFRMPEPGPESGRLSELFETLRTGSFDWVAVTSASTVEALVRHGVTIPSSTRVAVVGPATRSAMEAAGYRVDFMPVKSFSAQGMLAEWPESGSADSRVLMPQSAIAEPTLADGLSSRGFSVTPVTAYETTVLPWSSSIRLRAAAGDFDAVMLTSASMARAVAAEGVLPGSTVVACIGESTASACRDAGLAVHAVAESSTADGLVAALISCFSSHHLSSNRTKA